MCFVDLIKCVVFKKITRKFLCASSLNSPNARLVFAKTNGMQNISNKCEKGNYSDFFTPPEYDKIKSHDGWNSIKPFQTSGKCVFGSFDAY